MVWNVRQGAAEEAAQRDLPSLWVDCTCCQPLSLNVRMPKPKVPQQTSEHILSSHSDTFLHSTTAGTPYPYNQPTSTSSPSDIGEGSLSYYYGTSQTDAATEMGLESEEVEDDPIDYLLSCTSTPGSD